MTCSADVHQPEALVPAVARHRRPARVVGTASASSQRPRLVARLLQQIAASRTRSPMRSVGTPDCRVPKKSPGPRSARSRSASTKPSPSRPSPSAAPCASSLSGVWYSSTQVAASAPRPTRPRSWWSCDSPKRSACSTTITVAFGTSTPTSTTVVRPARGSRRRRTPPSRAPSRRTSAGRAAARRQFREHVGDRCVGHRGRGVEVDLLAAPRSSDR